MLYWVDDTDRIVLENRYEDEKLGICIAYVDNYDEVKSNTPEVNRPLVLAEIDKTISAYATKYNGFMRKYENDKYLLIFENKNLQIIQQKKV